MIIKGFRRTSLVDFPGNIVSTVFVAGCNFRCPFCHNPELVFDDPSLKRISEREVLGMLEKQRRYIDGVCVSGGEPTMHQDLPDFLVKIKAIGLKVKLDTNGSNPVMLRMLVEQGLVDYISMDIKSSLDNYSVSAGVKVDVKSILESIAVIMSSKVDYEFRTTVVPGLFDIDELKSICKEIAGAKGYYLQQFNPKTSLIDDKYASVKPFSADQMREFASFAEKFVQKCDIRNM